MGGAPEQDPLPLLPLGVDRVELEPDRNFRSKSHEDDGAPGLRGPPPPARLPAAAAQDLEAVADDPRSGLGGGSEVDREAPRPRDDLRPGDSTRGSLHLPGPTIGLSGRPSIAVLLGRGEASRDGAVLFFDLREAASLLLVSLDLSNSRLRCLFFLAGLSVHSVTPCLGVASLAVLLGEACQGAGSGPDGRLVVVDPLLEGGRLGALLRDIPLHRLREQPEPEPLCFFLLLRGTDSSRRLHRSSSRLRRFGCKLLLFNGMSRFYFRNSVHIW